MIKLFEALREGGVWKHIDLINISDHDREEVDRFKNTLRDQGIYFEPSSDGNYVHFEISCKSDDDVKFVDDYLRGVGINPYREEEISEKKLPIEDLVAKMKRHVEDKAVKEWGFDNPEDAFLNVYSEDKGDAIWIWLLGEFGYNTMSKLADELDKILRDNGYPDAYFDAEESGRWCAVLWK